MCKSLGAQPPEAKGFRHIRNYKKNQFLKGFGGNQEISEYLEWNLFKGQLSVL